MRASPSQWATATQRPHPGPRLEAHRPLVVTELSPAGAVARQPRVCAAVSRGAEDGPLGASLSGPHPLCTGQATLV